MQQSENPAEFTTEQYELSVKLLEDLQKLEREKHKLEFARHQVSVLKSVELRPMKMCLRKRTEQNQLKDIKFDFIPEKDSADAISNDLVQAGLLEMRNVVVVAANINKLVENPSLRKIVFPLGNTPQARLTINRRMCRGEITFMVTSLHP